MGFFSKLFKGPEIDLEKSAANAARMRELFDAVVPEGGKYRLIFGYTEDVSPVQLRLCTWQQDQNRQSDCGLGRGSGNHRGSAHSTGSVGLRRTHLLPPVGDSQGPAGTSTPPMPL